MEYVIYNFVYLCLKKTKKQKTKKQKNFVYLSHRNLFIKHTHTITHTFS